MRLGPLVINLRKEIGFVFTNRTISEMLDKNDWDLGDLQRVIEKDSSKYFAELIYAGAMTFCKETFKRPKFTYEGLIAYINMLADDDKKSLLDEIRKSEKVITDDAKKKAMRRKRT